MHSHCSRNENDEMNPLLFGDGSISSDNPTTRLNVEQRINGITPDFTVRPRWTFNFPSTFREALRLRWLFHPLTSLLLLLFDLTVLKCQYKYIEDGKSKLPRQIDHKNGTKRDSFMRRLPLARWTQNEIQFAIVYLICVKTAVVGGKLVEVAEKLLLTCCDEWHLKDVASSVDLQALRSDKP